MCIHLPFMYKKATQALNYFAEKNGGCLNKMKAIKLIFFADRYHVRKYGRPITNDEYLAMSYGPVNSGVKDIAEMSSFLGGKEREYAEAFLEAASEYDVKSIAPLEEKVFSKTDLEALDFAWKTFGEYDQFRLAEITHRYPEWKKHEVRLHNLSRVRMNYEDFLEDPEEGFEHCCTLSVEDKHDRLEEIKEMSRLNALWG